MLQVPSVYKVYKIFQQNIPSVTTFKWVKFESRDLYAELKLCTTCTVRSKFSHVPDIVCLQCINILKQGRVFHICNFNPSCDCARLSFRCMLQPLCLNTPLCYPSGNLWSSAKHIITSAAIGITTGPLLDSAQLVCLLELVAGSENYSRSASHFSRLSYLSADPAACPLKGSNTHRNTSRCDFFYTHHYAHICTHNCCRLSLIPYGLFWSRLFSTEERVRLLHASVNAVPALCNQFHVIYLQIVALYFSFSVLVWIFAFIVIKGFPGAHQTGLDVSSAQDQLSSNSC